MNLFGGAAKFVNFQNSKGESFVANSNGTQFGTLVNNQFVPHSIFVPTIDPMLSVPLTLEAMEASTVVTFTNRASGPVTYKVNGGTSQTIADGHMVEITLTSIGDKVEFFGDNATYYDLRNYEGSNIYCDKDCYIYGNVMSLVKSAGFESETTLTESYTFVSLFMDNLHLKNKDSADLLLPATTLTEYCYNSMFAYCTSLTTAPELPATTLADCCYDSMFYCCTSLTTAPELKATTLAASCYYQMFSDCANLNSVTCLATNISAYRCTTAWLSGVADFGTFTKATGMNDWTTGSKGIPRDWTVQDYIA